MLDVEFQIVLSKNVIARELRDLYKELKRQPSESVKFHFDEIEKATRVANQPTGRDILECSEFNL